MATSTYPNRSAAPKTNGAADNDEFIRKPIKLSDLPITSTQRDAINGLMEALKKKGEFDRIRNAVFADFSSSVCLQILSPLCRH
jgi:hypothetical protein